MRKLSLALLCALCALSIGAAVVMTACEEQPSRSAVNIRYLYDTRTNLCFATRWESMVAVPCTPEILILTGAPK